MPVQRLHHLFGLGAKGISVTSGAGFVDLLGLIAEFTVERRRILQ
jgi:hypothetical protein